MPSVVEMAKNGSFFALSGISAINVVKTNDLYMVIIYNFTKQKGTKSYEARRCEEDYFNSN